MNNTHTIFCICGRTASGKSSIAHRVSKDLGLKQLTSYTTRKPRASEIQFSDHIFINESDIDTYKEDIVAYTEINDNKYFATKNQLMESDIYVIDYEGIQFLKEKNIENLNLVIIFIDAKTDRRMGRYIARVVIKNRNYEKAINDFLDRDKSEQTQFNEIIERQDYDFMVDNSDDFESAVKQVKVFIKSKRG